MDKFEIFGLVVFMFMYVIIALIVVGLVIGEILCIYKFVLLCRLTHYTHKLIFR